MIFRSRKEQKAHRRGVVSLFNFCIGLIIGLFAGPVALVTHASPLQYPWIGLIFAAALVLVGGWFASEAAGIFGSLGYLVGVLLTTLGFMYLPFAGDVTALQTSIVSRIWVFAGPILACIPLSPAFRSNSR